MDISWKNITACMIISLIAGSFTSPPKQDKQEKKTIRRVRRPDFQQDKRRDVYFDDLFSEGLQGQRPARQNPKQLAAASNSSNTDVATTGDKWSQYVSRDAIEDEVKSKHRALVGAVTTPSKFNGQFANVRQNLHELSFLFGLIHEYDQDIRWKEYAATIQEDCAKTATSLQTPNKPILEACRLRVEDLGELIRGGSIEVNDNVSHQLEWIEVMERRPLMASLEYMLREQLMPAVASSNEFSKQKDAIIRRANMIAAMSHALIQDSMEEADEEEYAAWAIAMRKSAKQVIRAVENLDYELASQSVSAIDQSCINCHADWRG